MHHLDMLTRFRRHTRAALQTGLLCLAAAAAVPAAHAQVQQAIAGGDYYASDYSTPTAQWAGKAFDGNAQTQWWIPGNKGFVQLDTLNGAAYALGTYSITSAPDVPGGDPRDWRVQGSNDGLNWTTLDTQTGQVFTQRGQTRTYMLSGAAAYTKFRLDVQAVASPAGSIVHLAEWKLYGVPGTPVPAPQPIVTASGENAPAETAAKAVDGNPVTKWLTFSQVGWIQIQYPTAVDVTGFALTSANDHPVRDPVSVTLMGSHDGQSWALLHTVAQGVKFKNRYQRNPYELPQTASYPYYRILLSGNDVNLQLSEVELLRADDPFRAQVPATVIYENRASGTAGGQRFEQLVGGTIVKAAKEWSGKILRTLYPQPAAYHAKRTTSLTIEVVDEPGVAWASCPKPGTACFVTFSARRIADLQSWTDDDLRHEIIGMLIHELGHVYQYVDAGMPSYIIEGVADALRVRNGYHDLKPRVITGAYNASAQDIGEAATFYVWLDEFRKPGMLGLFNASLSPYDDRPFNEDGIFLRELGKTRAQLWNEARNVYWWQ